MPYNDDGTITSESLLTSSCGLLAQLQMDIYVHTSTHSGTSMYKPCHNS